MLYTKNEQKILQVKRYSILAGYTTMQNDFSLAMFFSYGLAIAGFILMLLACIIEYHI